MDAIIKYMSQFSGNRGRLILIAGSTHMTGMNHGRSGAEIDQLIDLTLWMIKNRDKT